MINSSVFICYLTAWLFLLAPFTLVSANEPCVRFITSLDNGSPFCSTYWALNGTLPDECKTYTPPAELRMSCEDDTDVVAESAKVRRKRTVYTKRAELTESKRPSLQRSLSSRIYFAYNSYDLTPESMKILDEIGIVLLDPALIDQVIKLEGHTDSVGSDVYNLRLSALRATAVRNYLVDRHRIGTHRLPIKGKGESSPLYPSRPTADENRRVEFVRTIR